MIATSLSSDRFTPGVSSDCVVVPRVWRKHTPIIYCHSAGMIGGEAIGVSQLPSVAPLVRTLASAGWPVAAPTLGTLWGNTTSLSRIDNALTWLRSHNGNSEPVILIGSSMGAAAALCWAAAHLSDVAAVVGIIPAVDLEALRAGNTANLRASIDAAYGVTYPAALPAGADPADLSFNGLPIQLWTASNDSVSVNASTIATDHRDVGALGHTDAAVAAVNATEVLEFVTNV